MPLLPDRGAAAAERVIYDVVLEFPGFIPLQDMCKYDLLNEIFFTKGLQRQKEGRFHPSNQGLVMSYYHNEAFENPDYHFSETLEIDRRESSQRNPFSQQAPYDSSLHGSYGEHRGREQSYPVSIPMSSLRPGSDYSQDLPSTSPYGNFTDKLSFEPEPELTYTPRSTVHLLDYPYTHETSSGSEDSFIRRRNRRPPDETVMPSSSMFETDPVCSEEEDSIRNLARMSSKERIKKIQKMPETMKKKREISFITIPQFLAAEPNNLSFTGLELFTGAGYFQQTVLYYGFYTNATISKIENGPSYNMQLAYILTVGIYFLICFIILLFSMAKYFYGSFIHPHESSGNASKLLFTWDFNITNEEAVKLKQKNLHTQIKVQTTGGTKLMWERLAEVDKEDLHFSAMERVCRFAIHLLAWVASLGVAVAACSGVYFLSINNLELFMKGYSNDLEGQSAMLVLPLIVSLLNTLIPFFFSWLGHMEKFQTPRQHLYVTIARNFILKMSIVGILCYYWLNIVATSESQCWETLVGQDIYRLVLVDFIFCLLGSFFGEFLRRIIGTTVCPNLGLPEFDIARNVLDLIYAQSLTWIGILFSPLLPGIQMIAFFIVFFVKKVSLMRNCQPPRKVWGTSEMMTSFILLLFCPSFLGVLSVIGVTVWRLKPSEACGPFRGLSAMYAAVSEWVETLESYTSWRWVAWIYNNLIKSELFFFILCTFALIVIYLYWEIVRAERTMMEQFRNQLENRSSSSYHPPRQPSQEVPDYLESEFDRNQNASYNEHPFSAGISSSSEYLPAEKEHFPMSSQRLVYCNCRFFGVQVKSGLQFPYPSEYPPIMQPKAN
ncbi:transmembrane channel-like protein 5 [Turdus rufiventris]|nr:transmembrane channel-like protein 5 [Turdus rufiventris]